MKITAKICISRTHGAQSDERPVHITLTDEASHVQFFDGEMRLEDFSSALLGLSHVEIQGEVRGLEFVGKRKITENRTITCPLKSSGRERMKEWLEENGREEGWILNSYLGAQSSISPQPAGTLLRYSVTRFEE